jgi:hypothetical protein
MTFHQEKHRIMNSEKVSKALNSMGWFIPPDVSGTLIESVERVISRRQGQFTQEDLERVLEFVYGADRLASMVLHRYPQTPVVTLYAETISEAVFAHFSGLRHVAVGGLVPVIEGIGKRLAIERGLSLGGGTKGVFKKLANDAKDDVRVRKIGATQEIVDMIDGFLHFVENYFYTQSQTYPLTDKTNRHGISHGAYTDADYGSPINFYKTIAALDFLTFIASLKTKRMSGFAPDHSTASKALAASYANCTKLR